MGGSQSAVNHASDTLGQASDALSHHADLLNNAMVHLNRARGGAITGGCACGVDYFGGATHDESAATKELRRYEESLSSNAKIDLIRKLVTALNQAGLNGLDPSDDPDVNIKKIDIMLPKPGGPGGFKNENHIAICEKIAKAMNDVLTPGAVPTAKFIDVSLGPESICRQVTEWMRSFTMGVNTEYLGVLRSVKNALANTETVQKVIDNTISSLRAKLSEDSSIADDAQNLLAIYDRAAAEAKRQMEILQHLLNVNLAPANALLENALREESSRHALVKRLGIVPGTNQFSDTIAAALGSISAASGIAYKVHKALKEAGIRVNDYLSAGKISDLDKLIAAAEDAARSSGKLKGVDAIKFMSALHTLRSNFDKDSGVEQKLKEALSSMSSNGTTGGARDIDEGTLEKRVKLLESGKTLMAGEFTRRLNHDYTRFLDAARDTAAMLGHGLPLDSNTHELRKALTRLRGVSTRRAEFALMGLIDSAENRDIKQTYLTAVENVRRAAETVNQAALASAAAAIISTVDSFTKTVADTYGVRTGGAPDAAVGGSLASQVASNVLSLADTLMEFDLSYVAAEIEDNIRHSAPLIAKAGENYSTVLGEAVAGRIAAIGKERADAFDYFNALQTAWQATANGPGAVNAGAYQVKGQPVTEQVAREFPKNGAQQEAASIKKFEAIKTFMESMFAAKVKFYKALQSIDLGLQSFTEDISRDPTLMSHLLKNTSVMPIISRYFTKDMGDFFCKAFESMGSVNLAGDARADGAFQADPNNAVGAQQHYYQSVTSVPQGVAHAMGIPFVSAPLPGASVASDNVGKMLSNYQILKNLVTVYSSVIKDSKPGVLNPVQLHKHLADYLKASAIAINIGQNGAAPVEVAAPAVQLAGGAGAGAIGAVAVAAAGTGAIIPYQVYFACCGMAGANDTLLGNFSQEDEYFVMAIKAMAGKILTAVGGYALLQKSRFKPVSFNPARVILGGGYETATPKSEAAELYFRLVRLIEWYRDLLHWDTGKDTALWKIAMVPDLEGTFSTLISFFFVQAGSPDTGTYTTQEINTIVREINKIYDLYMSRGAGTPSDITRRVLRDLIDDVNKRYGVVKREDMTSYEKMMREMRVGADAQDASVTDYAILPGEDQDSENGPERQAPSDQFYVPGPAGQVQAAGMARAITAQHALVKAFRKSISKIMSSTNRYDGQVYDTMIRQAEDEIKTASSPDSALAVVTRLIQSASTVGATSGSAFMFHETVVTGLNATQALVSMVTNFETAIGEMSVRDIENRIADALWQVRMNEAAVQATPLAAAVNAVANNVAAVNAAALLALVNLPEVRGNRPVIPAKYLVQAEAALDLPRVGSIIAGNGAAHYVALRAALGAIQNAAANADTPQRPSTYADQLPAPTAEAGKTAVALDHVRRLRTMARYMVKYNVIMAEYIETIFAARQQQLVSVQVIEQAGVQVSLTGVRSLFDELFTATKSYLNQLRSSFEPAALVPYEAAVLQIERDFVDQYIMPNTGNEYHKLDNISRRAGEVYRDLVRAQAEARLERGMDLAAAAGPGDGAEEFGRAISRLVFYDSVGTNDMPRIAVDTYDLGALCRDNQPAGGAAAAVAGPWIGAKAGAPPASRNDYYERAGTTMTSHRGLVLSLNQVLSHYLTVVTNIAGGQKIYAPLITSFANGIISRSTSDPMNYAFPDLSTAAVGAGEFCAGDPKPEAIILESLCWIIQRLVQDANQNTQISSHLVQTMTEVPMYLKEAMKANLPLVIELLSQITAKAEFIRDLIQKTNIKLGRPAGPGAAAGVLITDNAGADLTGQYGAVATRLHPVRVALADGETKTRVSQLLDQINAVAFDLTKTCQNALRELAESPAQFFVIGDQFLADYKARSGKDPLMPLSLSMALLSDQALNAGLITDAALFPNHAMGSAEFKAVYGYRALLSGDVSYTQFPGVKHLVDRFNATSSGKIESDKYASFMKATVDVLRWLVTSRNMKGMISVSQNLWSVRSAIGAIPANVRSYFIGRNATDLVMTVESTNQDSEISKVSQALQQVGARQINAQVLNTASVRERERGQNLLEINIMPINVHMLALSVPLLPTLNFSTTFEEMSLQMMGKAELPQNIGDTREMFMALLENPYREVTAAQYGEDGFSSADRSANLVRRLLTGNDGIGMSVPAAISDQVYNKVLFGSAGLPNAGDEAGPRATFGVTTSNRPQLAEQIKRYADLMASGFLAGQNAAAVYAAWNLNRAGFAVVGSLVSTACAFHSVVEPLAYAAADDAASMAIVAGECTTFKAYLVGVRNEFEKINRALNAVGAAWSRNVANQAREISDELARMMTAVNTTIGSNLAQYRANAQRVIRGANSVEEQLIRTDQADTVLERCNQISVLLANMNFPDQGGRFNIDASGSDLTYRTADGSGSLLNSAQVITPAVKRRLEHIGFTRFNTKLVRHTLFLANVFRVVETAIQQLNFTPGPVSTLGSHPVSEYGLSPFGANQVLDSTTINNSSANRDG